MEISTQIVGIKFILSTYMPQPKESSRIRSFQHYFLRNIGSYQHHLLWQIGFCKKARMRILIRKHHLSSICIRAVENLKKKRKMVIENCQILTAYNDRKSWNVSFDNESTIIFVLILNSSSLLPWFYCRLKTQVTTKLFCHLEAS